MAFLNCDSMFIEYNDVIKSPLFLFLNSIKDNQSLSTIFDLSEIMDLDIPALYEWYVNRKHHNIFKCLKLQDGVMEEYFENSIDVFNDWCEEIPYRSLDLSPYFVETDTELNFVEILNTLLSIGGSLVNKYYVYTPIKVEKIQKDLIELFGDKIVYVYGNLEDVLKENEVTSNSTFVFSDIQKILTLDKVGILNLSSIIIADRYAYNYKDEKTPIIDIDSLTKNSIFKLDFFNNIDGVN
jgi:hypothetical protein